MNPVFSELIDEARFLLAEDARPHLSPDQFKSKYGRCPIGFNTDPSTDRCAKIGTLRPGVKPSAVRPVPAKAAVAKRPEQPVVSPAEPSGDEQDGGPKEKSFIRKALGGVWHALSDPFKKAWKLATDKKYRTEVKDFVIKAAKKEGTQTKQMAGTFAKMLKGEKVSAEDKRAAIDQMVDVVKAAAMGAMIGHVAAGGVAKAIATLASPADEVIGVAVDKPLRAITKKVFGREYGILPSSFYEEGVRFSMFGLLSEGYKEGDEYKLIETMVDAIMNEMGKTDLSDEDVMRALMKGGLRAKKKGLISKILGALSPKEEAEPTLIARMMALL